VRHGLGWNFRKYRGKLLIKPSKSSCKNIADKVRLLIKKHRAITQDDLIRILNPVIRGWCNYHRPMVSKEAFKNLDSVLFISLWKWARHRHPMKSRQWVKNKYWTRIGGRDWIFSSKENTLYIAGRTKIVRHYMVRLDKNPFLTEDQEYFVGAVRTIFGLAGRKPRAAGSSIPVVLAKPELPQVRGNPRDAHFVRGRENQVGRAARRVGRPRAA